MQVTGAMSRRIELEIVVQCCIDGVGRYGHQHGVAVRRRARGSFGGEIATGSWPIINDELLAELLSQPLCGQARDNVGPATGREAHNDLHGSRRIGLSPGKT